MAEDADRQEPMPAADDAADGRELRHTQELLAEVRRQRDELERQVAVQRGQIEQANAERAELFRLIDELKVHLQPPRRLAPESEPAEPSLLRAFTGWREGKHGLGASLTLTGVVALVAGVLLHFALQQRIVVTGAHLGYIIGLIGLLTFLLGLLLVF